MKTILQGNPMTQFTDTMASQATEQTKYMKESAVNSERCNSNLVKPTQLMIDDLLRIDDDIRIQQQTNLNNLKTVRLENEESVTQSLVVKSPEKDSLREKQMYNLISKQEFDHDEEDGLIFA